VRKLPKLIYKYLYIYLLVVICFGKFDNMLQHYNALNSHMYMFSVYNYMCLTYIWI